MGDSIVILTFFLIPVSIVVISYAMFVKNRYDTMYVERIIIVKVKKENKNIDLMVEDLAKSIRHFTLFPRNIIVLDMLEDKKSKYILKKMCLYKGYKYIEDRDILCNNIFMD